MEQMEHEQVKIVFLHPSDELYGADKVLVELTNAVPIEWEIEVWLPTDVTYPERRLSSLLQASQSTAPLLVRHVPIPVLRREGLVRSLPLLFVRMGQVARLLHRAKADIVYVNTTALALAVGISRLASTARCIVHVHEFLRSRERLLLSILMTPAHRVLVVSNAILDPLSARIRRKAEVVYNGFDLPPPANASVPAIATRFLVASRWNKWKGHDVLLRAWKKAQLADAELHIYGAPPAHGSAEDVVGLVEQLGLADSVTIHGESNRIRDAIDAAHVVAVPSVLPDPLPTIAIEAAGAGRPIVASKSGGLVEIVDDGRTGWLVPPGDVCAWALALIRACDADLTQVGLLARAKFERSFSSEEFRANIRRALLSERDKLP